MSEAAPLRVAVWTDDPYLRAGLEAMLSAEPDLDVPALPAARDEPDVDVLVIEVPETAETEPAADLPCLALVGSPEEARAALGRGFRGAVQRRAAPELLLAALRAVAAGLVVAEPSTLEDTDQAAATPEDDPLTEREHEVLELLAEGRSNREIAEELGLSPHTAKFHVNAILDKMGAQTRTEAVVLALRSGYLLL